MGEPLDDQGFPLKPRNLSDDVWFYEGSKGLTIAVRGHGTLQSIVSVVDIPWRRLLPAFARYQKYQQRKKRSRRHQ